jgi:hypothetical protein
MLRSFTHVGSPMHRISLVAARAVPRSDIFRCNISMNIQ